jgi:hypothetical protein
MLGCHTNLDGLPVHLPLNRLLQRQQRNMHSIFQLQALGIPLLEKRLRAGSALPNRRSLPGKVTSTGINLVQARPPLQDPSRLARCLFSLRVRLALLSLLGLRLDPIIPARYEEADAVGSHAAGLRGFLHDARDILNEYPCRGVFVVDSLVTGVGDFAGFVDEDAVVRAHARVDHADVGGDEGDLGERGWVDER